MTYRFGFPIWFKDALQIAIAGTLSFPFALVVALPSNAQITPDATLGTENSIVTEDVFIRGALADLIEGGAIRDANLFHSFLEFNVDNGQRAYFANPDTITNIFSRVTGADPSDILGTLGVDGTANLFFLNPNGIIFGPNASLDIEGSFVGTTADAIQFGDEGFFSATEPESSSLLTVDPSALLFNQMTPRAITNTSVAFVGLSPSGIPLSGLRAAPNRSLLLIGGDINMPGGSIVGSGSRIELGGLAEPGVVGLEARGDTFQLRFPQASERADINLINDGRVGLTGN
ncbi:MAG: filamentous hemagglutinin N-terminal domain-containing protein, partial [Cyanobacteria bacterium J06633_2]